MRSYPGQGGILCSEEQDELEVSSLRRREVHGEELQRVCMLAGGIFEVDDMRGLWARIRGAQGQGHARLYSRRQMHRYVRKENGECLTTMLSGRLEVPGVFSGG